ncbi:hypothetical protein ACQKWADRAFT_280555 [Trichoderma austrokoningii]
MEKVVLQAWFSPASICTPPARWWAMKRATVWFYRWPLVMMLVQQGSGLTEWSLRSVCWLFACALLKPYSAIDQSAAWVTRGI